MFDPRSPCPGVLVVHLDESAWCSEPACETRTFGEATVARTYHENVLTCSDFFVDGCRACRDVEYWAKDATQH